MEEVVDTVLVIEMARHEVNVLNVTPRLELRFVGILAVTIGAVASVLVLVLCY